MNFFNEKQKSSSSNKRIEFSGLNEESRIAFFIRWFFSKKNSLQISPGMSSGSTQTILFTSTTDFIQKLYYVTINNYVILGKFLNFSLWTKYKTGHLNHQILKINVQLHKNKLFLCIQRIYVVTETKKRCVYCFTLLRLFSSFFCLKSIIIIINILLFVVCIQSFLKHLQIILIIIKWSIIIN